MFKPSDSDADCALRATIIDRNSLYSSFSDGIAWLRPRAELRIRIEGADSSTAGWFECQLELGCSRNDLPFYCYIYVEEMLEAVLEIKDENAPFVAFIRCPTGRDFTITIVSEISAEPLGEGEPPRSLFLESLQAIEPATDVPRPRLTLSALDDFYSQHHVRVVDRLPEPVFVFGAHGEGISALTQAIGRHPNIWPLETNHFLGLTGAGALVGFADAANASANVLETCDVSQEEFLAYIGDSMDRLLHRARERYELQTSLTMLAKKDDPSATHHPTREAWPPKRRWVDGTPGNAYHALLLHKMYPLAKFLCVIRNPGESNLATKEAVEAWKRLNTSALTAARALGSEHVKVVLDESLAADPRTQLLRIFSFLDEPRFATATDTLQRYMNGWSISAAERESTRECLQNLPAEYSPLPLYEELASLAASTWAPEKEARRALETTLHDLVNDLRGQVRRS